MAACSLFEEDEVYVYKPGKGYSFGLVLENSEFLSSSEEDEAELPEDRLHKGTVRVAWHPTGRETVVPEEKVQLLDRSLMPGDVVRRLIPGQESQCGFVMDMDVRCHLHVLRTNKYIYNINSKDLQPLQKFEGGQEVMFGSWLGRVESVTIHVVLVFSDGARCQVDENDIFAFVDVSEKRTRHGEFSVCLYYPGQELKGPLDCLSDAKWLRSTPRFCHRAANSRGKGNTVHVTIEKIVNKSVEIHWLFRGCEKNDSATESVNPPPNVIEGDDVERLKVLDWFNHCSIQIGDRMTYRIKNDDLVSTVEPGKVYDPNTAGIKDAPIQFKKSGSSKSQEENSNTEESSTAMENETDNGEDGDFEDVDDDNSDSDEKHGACGSRGAGGGRAGRKRARGLKGQRHKPGKPVHSQKLGEKKRGPKERQVKADEVVEVETELTTSWATVMWQDGTVERDIPSVELFPVHHLDELEFFPGDFVLPSVELTQPADYGVVVKADHGERTCVVHWYKAYEVGKATAPDLVDGSVEMSVYDIKDHPDYKFRPGQSVVRVGGFENLPEDPEQIPQAVGQIFDLDPNGHLVVKWADGSVRQCYPQEVFIVSEDADEVSDNNSLDSWTSESDYETDGSRESWETESEQEIIGEDGAARGERDDSGYDQDALCEHKQELDSLLSRAETALNRLQTLLNNFDVSTVAIPECFHDIIRIYRSCHDLDKIVQSSFFSDPELQSLISQAKKELRRDRANKISRHLSQLFEAWSNSLPADDTESVGTVAFGGKTIRIGALRKGAGVAVTLQVPSTEGEPCDNSVSAEKTGAAGPAESLGGGDNSEAAGDCTLASNGSENSSHLDEDYGGKGLKKESSEPTISKLGKNAGGGGRRGSDPLSEANATSGARSKKKNTDANLVGENCVSKAAKRTKSDSFEDSGHEAKKSRDETAPPNRVAQELCFKICQNLQKQILKVHAEVNKRTKRLMTVASKSEKGHGSMTNVFVDTSNSQAENAEPDQQGDESNKEDRSGLVEWESSQVDETSGEVEEDHSEATISQPPSENANLIAAIDNDPGKAGKTEKGGSCPDADGKGSGDESTQEAVVAEGVEVEEDSARSSSNSLSCQKEDEASATLEDIKAVQVPCKGFDMCGEAQLFHRFISQQSQPSNPRSFRTAVRKELKLFQSSLPDGIFIKGFEDRLDLYSVMILGPEGTPYEDALFLFDFMLPNDYPNSPPLCYYYSFCSDRLNPNLYEDGKVCVSLLGTWSGKGTEVWTSKSTLLQVLLSIQGLILVPEPYYNEAGYERQRGTQVGQENSRMYNEMAVLKTVQSLTKMCHNLPTLFKQEIYQYLKARGHRMIARLQHWMKLNELQRKQVLSDPSNSAQNMEHRSQSHNISAEAAVTHKVSPPLTNGSHGLSNELNKIGATPSQNGLQTDACSQGTNKIKEEVAAAEARSVTSQHDVDGEDSTSVDYKFRETIQAVNDLHINSAVPSNSREQCDAVHSNETISGTKLPNGDVSLPLSVGLSGLSPPAEMTCPDEGTPVDITVTPDSNPVVASEQSLPVAANEINGKQVIGESAVDEEKKDSFRQPEFPLFPMSKGFCLTLQKFLQVYEKALDQLQDPASS